MPPLLLLPRRFVFHAAMPFSDTLRAAYAAASFVAAFRRCRCRFLHATLMMSHFFRCYAYATIITPLFAATPRRRLLRHVAALFIFAALFSPHYLIRPLIRHYATLY